MYHERLRGDKKKGKERENYAKMKIVWLLHKETRAIQLK